MGNQPSPTVAIITVGDELLVGDTINTNAAWLGRELTDLGATVSRVIVVPDRIDDIVREIRDFRERYDAIIITGGLGPTHDDVTMEAVAEAFDRPMMENEEALHWLIEEGGYTHDDLVVGTADLPAGATPLHNDVGVAPGAIVDSIYVLPGVPSEMKGMFETIADQFDGDRVYERVIRTPEPESALVDLLIRARDQFGVMVGSYPGEDVRIKIRGTDEEAVKAAVDWLRKRIKIDE